MLGLPLSNCYSSIQYIWNLFTVIAYRKRFYLYRLELVNKDLPVAYTNWTETLIQKCAMRNSLVVEMKDKSNVLVEVSSVSFSESIIISLQQACIPWVLPGPLSHDSGHFS